MMPQHEIPLQAIRLSDLSAMIKAEISKSFQWREFLIVAETSDVKDYPDRQYCFVSLVEKEESRLLAKSEAVIWKSSYHTLLDFKKATGRALSRDMKILMKVNVDYHEVYGLKLVIKEIDASFSIGQFELERQRVINRLLAVKPTILRVHEGNLVSLNQELRLPLVIRRIALITSPDSDGGRDFLHELKTNPDGYTFMVARFDVQMQGEQSIYSVPQVLNKMKPFEYDVAVLIRGGGSSSDLSVFDRFEIASAVAACRIPVITGIGHERNLSLCDLVSFMNVKTPTKAAVYILEHRQRLERTFMHLTSEVSRLATRMLKEQSEKIHQIGYRLNMKAQLMIASQKRKLEKAETVIRMADPVHILKKGYAMLYNHKHEVITRSEGLEQEKVLMIRTHEQFIETEIKNIKPWEK
jgi:exodeoxyribonuclease VII large subunit